MLLYRAQAMPDGLRMRTPHGNEPAARIAGRWFTDDLAAATRHLDTIAGAAQIVCIELPDAVAESFRVSATPFTVCGLAAIDHSDQPERDFVIPRFFAMRAEEVERVADEGNVPVVTLDIRQRLQMGLRRIGSRMAA